MRRLAAAGSRSFADRSMATRGPFHEPSFLRLVQGFEGGCARGSVAPRPKGVASPGPLKSPPAA